MEREGERDREKENKKTNLKKNGKENEIERDVADHTPRRFVSSRARAWRRCLPCLHGQDFNSIDCQAFDKKNFLVSQFSAFRRAQQRFHFHVFRREHSTVFTPVAPAADGHSEAF